MTFRVGDSVVVLVDDSPDGSTIDIGTVCTIYLMAQENLAQVETDEGDRRTYWIKALAPSHLYNSSLMKVLRE